jgi:phosphoglycerate dehydrogenase-like enzyme
MLESCKIKRPILINVGRGSLISEDALLNALGKDWISGAILDVFVDEPLSADSPLWQHPKITSSF